MYQPQIWRQRRGRKFEADGSMESAGLNGTQISPRYWLFIFDAAMSWRCWFPPDLSSHVLKLPTLTRLELLLELFHIRKGRLSLAFNLFFLLELRRASSSTTTPQLFSTTISKTWQTKIIQTNSFSSCWKMLRKGWAMRSRARRPKWGPWLLFRIGKELRLDYSDHVLTTFSISKVVSDKPIIPYIKTTKNGAQVDPSYLVKPEERRLANEIRTAQDPLTVKRAAEQVRCISIISLSISSMRTIPNCDMTQNLAPFWVPPCNNDVLYIHSYTEKNNTNSLDWNLLPRPKLTYQSG